MSSPALRSVLAAVVVLLIALLSWRPDTTTEPTRPAVPTAGANEVSERSSTLLDAPTDRPLVTGVDRVSAQSVPAQPDASVGAQFVFDVTFVAVDGLGRRQASKSVGFALAQHRPNVMGSCDANGELHCTWRGAERELDGFFGAMGASAGWSRVHLVAGQPITLRFCIDTPRMPAAVDGVTIVRSGHADDPFGPSDIEFELDGAGNGVFTDPDLMVRRVNVEIHAVGRPTPFSTRRLSSIGYGRGSASRKPVMTTIECVAHDVDGSARTDVPVRTFPKVRGHGSDGRTDADGRFTVMQLPVGGIDVEFGGGIFALQRKTFDLTLGNQTWDVQLARVPIVRGQLTDVEHVPLRSWRIQAREDRHPFGFMQSCITDMKGRFVVGLDHVGFVRLLADPPEGDDRPARIVADHVGPGPDDLFLSLPDPKLRVQATWHFDASKEFIGLDPQACVVRVDSGECTFVGPYGSFDAGEGRTRWNFRLDRVLPGEYELTNFAPGARSELQVRLAQEQEEIGNIPLEGSMKLVLVSDETATSELWSARVLQRVQGIEVRSLGAQQGGTFLVPAGDLELQVTTTAADRVLSRRIHGTAGDRIEIRLGDLRVDPLLRAEGAAQR